MEMKHGLHLQQKHDAGHDPALAASVEAAAGAHARAAADPQAELQQNPLLEEVLEYDESEEPVAETDAAEAPAPMADSDPEREVTVKDEEEKSLAEWEEYWRDGYDGHYSRGEVQSAEDFYEKVPITIQTLSDYLEAQLRLATSDPEWLRIGEYLIGTMDDRGYLTMTDAEVAEALGVELEKVAEMVEILKTFDPPGVAARDLRECLLIQLRIREEDGSLAHQIVEKEFENLKERRFHEIARALKISVEQVQEAADVVATLNPRPGNEIAAEEAKYVMPDLIVERVDEDYVVF